MNTFQTVRHIVQEELQFDYPLPPYVDNILNVLSKAHIYYRTYKYEQISRKTAQDPTKGHPAVYGAALQLASDYPSIVSYAINVALVAKCTLDLLQEYRQLSESYQRLCQVIDWQYPLYYSVKLKQKVAFSNSLSPSLHFILQVQMMDLVRQMLKICRCALDVFWQIFKLSMCLCDAYLLFNHDPRIRYEACTELVADWKCYRNQLQENQKRLFEEIQKKYRCIDHILNRLGIDKSSTFILEQLKEKVKGLVVEAGEELGNLYDRTEETLDTLYAKGKITSLHINLTAGKAATPALPAGRFPPWGGQAIILASSKPLKTLF
jgi:hypothetical protein